MRKLITLFLFIAIAATSMRAEYRKVATFQDNYNTHEVGVTVTESGNWFILVDFDSKTDNQVSLIYSPGQLDDLYRFFKDLKDKYLEWVKVARENGVDKITKRMPLQSPTAVAMWVNDNDGVSYSTDTMVFEPLFSNTDNSGQKFYVFNVVAVEDKDNSSITYNVHMNFQNAMQLQSVINALNPSRLREAARRPAQRSSSSGNLDDLFK